MSAVAPALVNLGLGHRDACFECIELAVREKSGWLVYIKTDPHLDELRGDARFEQMLEVVGLSELEAHA